MNDVAALWFIIIVLIIILFIASGIFRKDGIINRIKFRKILLPKEKKLLRSLRSLETDFTLMNSMESFPCLLLSNHPKEFFKAFPAIQKSYEHSISKKSTEIFKEMFGVYITRIRKKLANQSLGMNG
jgi:hypothetical protein